MPKKGEQQKKSPEKDIIDAAKKEKSSDEYRKDQLISLGFSQEQAAILILNLHLSISVVRETYIKKGCTPEQAFRILSQ